MLITKEFAMSLLPQRPAESNKGTFGKVLNIAGCINYQGAAYLSSLAPLKAGAGLVTLASIETVINNLASCAPWITFLPLKSYGGKCISHRAFKEIKKVIDSYNVVSIGPGLSDCDAVGCFVEDTLNYLKDFETKVVIDADALNIIAKSDIKSLPENSVITPHPLELSRLLEVPVDVIQSDRVSAAKLAAGKFGCNVVLKGKNTIICCRNGEVFENQTGNSSLAKAGSGDVLTGMIAGFAAQGLDIVKASVLGVYLHGLCGELASCDLTEYCVLATNQIDYIPKAIKTLLEQH